MGRQQPAHLAAICEYAAISHPMSVWTRHQRREPPEKVERIQNEGGGPASMRPPPGPGASGRRKWRNWGWTGRFWSGKFGTVVVVRLPPTVVK
jgi:hypothetical protein